MDNLIEFLRTTELLAETPLLDIEYLSQFCAVISKKKDDKIFQIGDILSNVYFIKSGIVQISIVSTNNKLELLPDEHVGDVLGEMEIWDEHPVIALCTAKTDVILVQIDKNDFKKFLATVPDTREKLFAGTIKKWRNLESLFHKNINLLAEAIERIDKDEQLLMQQREQIKEESRLKEIFIENISHELRTPLTVIRALIESFDTTDKTKAVLDYDLYLKLQSSSSYLLDLINELLDFSQLTKGDIILNQQWINISNEFSRVLDNFLLQTNNDKIKITYSLPEPSLIYVDISRVRQILYHLVSNAIKFTEKGSVSIKIYYKSMRKSSCIFCIVVKDSGIGIREEDKTIIFNKFVRLQNKFSSIHGTGMGLPLVKNLVELMNGTIIVQSEVNIGSEFKVEIPVNYRSIAYLDLVSEEIDFSDKDKIVQVLLIDDYEDTHVIVKNLLKKDKFKIDSLFDSSHVIEMISEKDYDVILLDIMLPEIDGYKILEMIKNFYSKNAQWHPSPKIIAFTALGSEEEILKINSSGFDGKLLKPFSRKDLLKALIPRQLT